MSDSYPEIKPHHAGISVPNLDESIAWYQNMFGFELEMRAYIDVIPANVAFIRRGDFRIELFELSDAASLPDDRREPNRDLLTHGNKHVCFAVHDTVSVVAGLRKKGADIVFEKVIKGTPMAFIRDNAGNLLELIQAPELLHSDVVIDRSRFDDYIQRFNRQDDSAFDDYLSADVQVLNGALKLSGVAAMKQHYEGIWASFNETIEVEQFVSDNDSLSVRMHTHFEATRDDSDTVFGSVVKGDCFDFRGVVMYRIHEEKFTHIWVAYNSFIKTSHDGKQLSLGMPH